MQIGASVLFHVGRGVATVTLNRPHLFNTIDENMRGDLRTIFQTIREQDEVRAVILTGAGQNFSVGSDVGAMEMGIVDELVLPGKAMSAAWNMAERLADRPVHSVRSTKSGFRVPIEEISMALENEVHGQTRCLLSEDFIEGVHAVRERRRPDFSR